MPKDNHCERVLRTVCAPAVRRQACKRGGSESPRAVMRAESAAIRVQVSARGPTYPNCGPTTRLRPNACLSATKEAVPVQPSPRSRPGSNGGPPSLSFIRCQRVRFPDRFGISSELSSVAARPARPWDDPGGRYVCLVVHLSCSWHIGHARPRACALTWCAHRGHAQLTRPDGCGMRVAMRGCPAADSGRQSAPAARQPRQRLAASPSRARIKNANLYAVLAGLPVDAPWLAAAELPRNHTPAQAEVTPSEELQASREGVRGQRAAQNAVSVVQSGAHANRKKGVKASRRERWAAEEASLAKCVTCVVFHHLRLLHFLYFFHILLFVFSIFISHEGVELPWDTRAPLPSLRRHGQLGPHAAGTASGLLNLVPSVRRYGPHVGNLR